jgi:hypothetical protein
MNKASIFHRDDFNALLRRIETLQPDSPRKWGKMTPAQMLAHLNVPLETGLGKINPPREGNMITRPLARWYVTTRTRFPRNLPTLKAFVIREQRDFKWEKQRLLANLYDSFALGLNGYWHPHHAFGTLSAQQWGELTHLHLDHHLRQFGV